MATLPAYRVAPTATWATVESVSTSSAGVSSTSPSSSTPWARMSSAAPRMRSTAASSRLSNAITTTRDHYNRHIGAKTAALFAAACEIGPVIADAGPDTQTAMRDFGYNLGMAFQITDDILDYTGDHAKLGKTLGDDFREGKLTAPVLLALSDATAEERAFWTRTMADRQQDDSDLAHAIAIITRHHGFARGMALAHDYAATAHAALAHVQAGIVRDTLADVLDFSVNRMF